MQAKLTVIAGKTNKPGVKISLPTVIGRSPGADVTIAHPMISRRHCELYEVDGLVHVRDLGSLNGTQMGGQRIDRAVLRPKAEFTIGPLTFRIDYEYAGKPDIAISPAPSAEKRAKVTETTSWQPEAISAQAETEAASVMAEPAVEPTPVKAAVPVSEEDVDWIMDEIGPATADKRPAEPAAESAAEEPVAAEPDSRVPAAVSEPEREDVLDWLSEAQPAPAAESPAADEVPAEAPPEVRPGDEVVDETPAALGEQEPAAAEEVVPAEVEAESEPTLAQAEEPLPDAEGPSPAEKATLGWWPTLPREEEASSISQPDEVVNWVAAREGKAAVAESSPEPAEEPPAATPPEAASEPIEVPSPAVAEESAAVDVPADDEALGWLTDEQAPAAVVDEQAAEAAAPEADVIGREAVDAVVSEPEPAVVSESSSEPAGEDVLDWISDAGPTPVADVPIAAVKVVAPVGEIASPPVVDEPEPAVAAEASAEPTGEDVLDWLSDAGPTPVADEAAAAVEEVSPLAEIASPPVFDEPEPAVAAEASAEPTGEDVPDWISDTDATPVADEPIAAVKVVAPVGEIASPPVVDEPEPAVAAEASAEPTGEDVLDWISDAGPTPVADEPIAAVEEVAPVAESSPPPVVDEPEPAAAAASVEPGIAEIPVEEPIGLAGTAGIETQHTFQPEPLFTPEPELAVDSLAGLQADVAEAAAIEGPTILAEPAVAPEAELPVEAPAAAVALSAIEEPLPAELAAVEGPTIQAEPVIAPAAELSLDAPPAVEVSPAIEAALAEDLAAVEGPTIQTQPIIAPKAELSAELHATEATAEAEDRAPAFWEAAEPAATDQGQEKAEPAWMPHEEIAAESEAAELFAAGNEAIYEELMPSEFSDSASGNRMDWSPQETIAATEPQEAAAADEPPVGEAVADATEFWSPQEAVAAEEPPADEAAADATEFWSHKEAAAADEPPVGEAAQEATEFWSPVEAVAEEQPAAEPTPDDIAFDAIAPQTEPAGLQGDEQQPPTVAPPASPAAVDDPYGFFMPDSGMAFVPEAAGAPSPISSGETPTIAYHPATADSDETDYFVPSEMRFGRPRAEMPADEEAGDACAGKSPPADIEPAGAELPGADEPPPTRKRWWWPFGGKKAVPPAKAAAEETPAAPLAAEEEPAREWKTAAPTSDDAEDLALAAFGPPVGGPSDQADADSEQPIETFDQQPAAKEAEDFDAIDVLGGPDATATSDDELIEILDEPVVATEPPVDVAEPEPPVEELAEDIFVSGPPVEESAADIVGAEPPAEFDLPELPHPEPEAEDDLEELMRPVQNILDEAEGEPIDIAEVIVGEGATADDEPIVVVDEAETETPDAPVSADDLALQALEAPASDSPPPAPQPAPPRKPVQRHPGEGWLNDDEDYERFLRDMKRR